jgi:G patch domain/KOW motif-containing protein
MNESSDKHQTRNDVYPDNEVGSRDEEVSGKRVGIVLKSNVLPKRQKLSDNQFASNGFLSESTRSTQRETDFIYSIAKNHIESSIKVKVNKPLVIPLVGGEAVSEPNAEVVSIEEKAVPLLSRHIGKDIFECKTDEERFRVDLKNRPDDMHVKSDIYEAVPVEQFGAALLRGMGWNGTGNDNNRNNSSSSSKNAINLRPFRLGLGAVDPTGKPPSSSKEKEKKQAKNVPQPFLLPRKDGLSIGSFIISSELSGLSSNRGRIIQLQSVPGLAKVRIELENSGQIIDVSKSSISLISSQDLRNNPLTFPIQDIVEAKEDDKKSSSASIEDPPKKKEQKPEPSEKPIMKDQPPAIPWIREGIRVKLISKKIGNSSVYLQKGTVIDVHQRGEGTVRFDNGQLLEAVKEKYLETVLPSAGSSCIVLLGTNQGETATLVEKHSERNIAVIQLTDSLEVIEISMDNIAAQGYL